MRMLVEQVDDVQYLTEDYKGQKCLHIKGIFLQSEQKNRNGRIYPRSLLEREVARYLREWVNQGRGYGELGHPDTPTINLDRVSHIITELKQDGNDWVGKARVIKEGNGKIVHGLIDAGGRIGVSSRGVGTWKMVNEAKLIQDDYHLSTAADIVADPSAPDAFVNSLMEQREWVWSNGEITEATVASIYADIKQTKAKQLEEAKLAAFRRFMDAL